MAAWLIITGSGLDLLTPSLNRNRVQYLTIHLQHNSALHCTATTLLPSLLLVFDLVLFATATDQVLNWMAAYIADRYPRKYLLSIRLHGNVFRNNLVSKNSPPWKCGCQRVTCHNITKHWTGHQLSRGFKDYPQSPRFMLWYYVIDHGPLFPNYLQFFISYPEIQRCTSRVTALLNNLQERNDGIIRTFSARVSQSLTT